MAFDLNAAIGGGANIINLASGFNKLAQDMQFGDQERAEALKTRQLQNEAAQLSIDTAQFNLNDLQQKVQEKKRVDKFREDAIRIDKAQKAILKGTHTDEDLVEALTVLNIKSMDDLNQIKTTIPAMDNLTKNAGLAMQGNANASKEVSKSLAEIYKTSPENIKILPGEGVYITNAGGTNTQVIDFKKNSPADYLKNVHTTAKLVKALDQRLAAAEDEVLRNGTSEFKEKAYKVVEAQNNIRQMLELTTDPSQRKVMETVLAMKSSDAIIAAAPKIMEQGLATIASSGVKAATDLVDSDVVNIKAKYGSDYKGAVKAFSTIFDQRMQDPKYAAVIKQSGLSPATFKDKAITAIQNNSTVTLGMDLTAAKIKATLADANMKNMAASKAIQQGERARELTNQMNGLQQQRKSYEAALTDLNDSIKSKMSNLTEEQRVAKVAAIESAIKTLDTQINALNSAFFDIKGISVPQGAAIPAPTAAPAVSKEDLLKQPVKPFGVKQALPIGKKSDILNPKNKVNNKPKYDTNKG